MSLATLRERVAEGVQERMLPILFERYKRSHMKRNWRECDCSYCERKKKTHAALQFAPYRLNWHEKQEWRENRINYCRANLATEAEKVL